MNTVQFIILSIFFLGGMFCQLYNLLTELNKSNVIKANILLQVVAIICLTVVYGLGVIATFAGIYKT